MSLLIKALEQAAKDRDSAQADAAATAASPAAPKPFEPSVEPPAPPRRAAAFDDHRAAPDPLPSAGVPPARSSGISAPAGIAAAAAAAARPAAALGMSSTESPNRAGT